MYTVQHAAYSIKQVIIQNTTHNERHACFLYKVKLKTCNILNATYSI